MPGKKTVNAVTATKVVEEPKNKNESTDLHLIRDLSQSRVGVMHYVCMFLWLGWFLFYFILPVILVVLFFYSTIAFTAVLGLIATSALYPIKWKLQPKMGFALGRYVIQHAAEYLRVSLSCIIIVFLLILLNCLT